VSGANPDKPNQMPQFSKWIKADLQNEGLEFQETISKEVCWGFH